MFTSYGLSHVLPGVTHFRFIKVALRYIPPMMSLLAPEAVYPFIFRSQGNALPIPVGIRTHWIHLYWRYIYIILCYSCILDVLQGPLLSCKVENLEVGESLKGGGLWNSVG